jgi:predicted DNA-binding transcriptional regulator AlpA
MPVSGLLAMRSRVLMTDTDTTPAPATQADAAATAAKPVYARETRISELYGIPVPTLRTRRVRSPNAPPFIKVGRSVLYRVSDVEHWIESEAAKGGKQ